MKLIHGLLLIGGVFTLILFNNCGKPLHTADSNGGVLSLSSQMAQLGEVAFTPSLDTVQVDKDFRVQRWLDQSKSGLTLIPPLRAGTSAINMNLSPTYQPEQQTLKFQAGEQLWINIPNYQETTADAYTLHVALSRLTPRGDLANNVFRPVHLVPISGDASGYLGFDVAFNDQKHWQLWVFFWYDERNYSSRTEILPENFNPEAPLVVSLSFGKAPEQIGLAVNGKVGASKVAIVGNPSHLSFAGRHLTIGSPLDWQQLGGATIHALGVNRGFVSEAELIEQNRTLFAAVTGVVINTPIAGGGGGGGTNTLEQEVLALFRNTKNTAGRSCTECHAELSNPRWIKDQSGWVVAKQSANSKLIKALRKEAGVMAMPQGGGAMPASDINKIATWIDGL